MDRIEAFFTSGPKESHPKQAVYRILERATHLALKCHEIELHIAQFSITDKEILDQIVECATEYRFKSVKVIVDWCQGGPGSGRQIDTIDKLQNSNIHVRYKKDQPYVYDHATSSLRWSYNASRGLLHHKFILLIIDSRPSLLVCGSYNLTLRAKKSSYENLILIEDSDDSLRDVIYRFEDEFRHLWCSSDATLSKFEAQLFYQHIHAMYKSFPLRYPRSISGSHIGEGATWEMASSQIPKLTSATWLKAKVAFSYRGCDQLLAQNGISPANSSQRYNLIKPSGRLKSIPQSISSLSLGLIHRAKKLDYLKIAMFAFSPRVSEYSALIDAARRGVLLYIITDRRTSKSLMRSLGAHQSLPIHVKMGYKYMHQKYIVHPQSSSVLTGTANLTADSESRHSENRILFDGYPGLARLFEADFDRIWQRLL